MKRGDGGRSGRSKRHPLAAVALLGVALAAGAPARAEEGGSGHYFPGAMASFVDGVAPAPAFLVRYNTAYYTGSVGADRPIPIAGQTALGVDASSWANALTLFWRPPVELGGAWSYAMSATIPFVSMNVSAGAVVNGTAGGSRSIALSDSLGALGDVVVQPLMLNYNVSPDSNVNFRVSLYMPTGSYETGRLANTGKNFWTVEPTLAFIYLGTKNGRELSVFVGADFNTENSATNYQSGTQIHVDGTLAQHLPLFCGVAGAGLSTFYYRQVTGDSGTGATLGDFKATTAGVGPVISYTRKLGDQDLIVELKWLHEYHTENRLKGDTLFLKAMVKF